MKADIYIKGCEDDETLVFAIPYTREAMAFFAKVGLQAHKESGERHYPFSKDTWKPHIESGEWESFRADGTPTIYTVEYVSPDTEI